MFSNYFLNIVPLMRQCAKYCRAGQTTDDNTVPALCKLDNKGYGHTHTHTHSL